MIIKDEWRAQLFEQAKALGLTGDVFQNRMNIHIKDLVFELTEIELMRNKRNSELDQYAASVRSLIREGVEMPITKDLSQSTSEPTQWGE